MEVLVTNKNIMHRTIIVLTIALFLWGCQNPTEKGYAGEQNQEINCNPYFLFDEVIQYSIKIDARLAEELGPKKNKTEQEENLTSLLIGPLPLTLSDTTLLKEAENVGYVRTSLDNKYFQQIEEIFCERKHKDGIAYACMPIYRDILVFKRKNKIIGTAKICFTCRQHRITGTTLNTEMFGQSGDFGKLDTLLHRLNVIR